MIIVIIVIIAHLLTSPPHLTTLEDNVYPYFLSVVKRLCFECTNLDKFACLSFIWKQKRDPHYVTILTLPTSVSTYFYSVPTYFDPDLFFLVATNLVSVATTSFRTHLTWLCLSLSFAHKPKKLVHLNLKTDVKKCLRVTSRPRPWWFHDSFLKIKGECDQRSRAFQRKQFSAIGVTTFCKRCRNNSHACLVLVNCPTDVLACFCISFYTVVIVPILYIKCNKSFHVSDRGETGMSHN